MPNTEHQTPNTVKIPFDSLTLRGVVGELRPLLVGGQIQEIRQPTPAEITLTVRNLNRSHTLLLSVDPQFARAHLTTRRRANPPTPPNFCMILRKYLEDSWIRDVRQIGFDRILEIETGSRNPEEEAATYSLVVELMGKHSNLILINEEGAILDAAKRISKRINRVREILPGLAYQPPPTQSDKVSPFVRDAVPFLVKEIGSNLHITPQEFADMLLSLYVGLSPFLAREMAHRFATQLNKGANQDTDTIALPASDLKNALTALWEETFNLNSPSPRALRGKERGWGEVIAHDESGHAIGAYPISITHLPSLRQERVASLNAALDEAFTFQMEQAGFVAIAGELRGQLQQESKRVERQQQSVAKTLAEAERSELYKQTGELILANLWKIQPGNKEIVVQDYYDPNFPDRSIELDPKISAQENADHYFKRYRKARDAEERALEESVRLENQSEELKVATSALNNARTEEELRALRADLLARHILRHAANSSDNPKKSQESEFAGHKIRRYHAQGFDILVGESATANDYLTLRVASPNDWWLHVRAAVSAHVVVRSLGKPYEVPRPVLERAALICAQHSQQKHSSLVSVDYTLKKYVRKPRGSAPGAADYLNEQTLDVTPG